MIVTDSVIHPRVNSIGREHVLHLTLLILKHVIIIISTIQRHPELLVKRETQLLVHLPDLESLHARYSR